jgi:hypothetical protein
MSVAATFIGTITARACHPVMLNQEETCRLCQRPYSGHPRGCPNYGSKHGCPPGAAHLDGILDLTKQVALVVAPFDLAGFAKRMTELHPAWTAGMCRNPRYWQAVVVKELRKHARFAGGPTRHVVEVPEAHGVDVTATCASLGIVLEWPPVNIVCKVMLVGCPQ